MFDQKNVKSCNPTQKVKTVKSTEKKKLENAVSADLSKLSLKNDKVSLPAKKQVGKDVKKGTVYLA